MGSTGRGADLIVKANLSSFGLALSEKTESQDAFAVQTWNELVIAVMADGVGDSQYARESATKIVAALTDNFKSRPRSWSIPKALEEFTRLLNRSLYQESIARFDTQEMLSTLSAVVIEGHKLYGLNVGDTRVYLLHQGKLRQLSQDHVEPDPQLSHALTRAMGMEPDVVPHGFEHSLAEGDMLLLCTDGVHQVLPEAEIAQSLRARIGARSIIASARQHATPENLDDMSAIVIEILALEQSQATNPARLEVIEELKRGQIIDSYTLLEPLQASERTWTARAQTGQSVVLKFAPLAARDNETVLNQFVREIWNVTRLEAEFFPKAFLPENSRYLYYGMDLIAAPTLKQFLAQERLPIDGAIALGLFLLEVCQYLLRFDLIHGDIKPENILVLKQPSGLAFKLVDFGSMNEIFSVTSRAGTPSYLAPERFQGAASSERTEIFSIGVTLYLALTRQFPFGEIEPFQSPVFNEVKKPTTKNPNIPPWLEAVLLRATAATPENRYLNYSEMRFDLTHPEKVKPFRFPNTPLIERNPLLFYKTGFYLLLILTVYLLFRLFGGH